MYEILDSPNFPKNFVLYFGYYRSRCLLREIQDPSLPFPPDRAACNYLALQSVILVRSNPEICCSG